MDATGWQVQLRVGCRGCNCKPRSIILSSQAAEPQCRWSVFACLLPIGRIISNCHDSRKLSAANIPYAIYVSALHESHCRVRVPRATLSSLCIHSRSQKPRWIVPGLCPRYDIGVSGSELLGIFLGSEVSDNEESKLN